MREGGFRWYHETAASLLLSGARPLGDSVVSTLPDGLHEVVISKIWRGADAVTVIYAGRANRKFRQCYELGSRGYTDLLSVCRRLEIGTKLKIKIVTGGKYDVYTTVHGTYIVTERESKSIYLSSKHYRDVAPYRPDRFVLRHYPALQHSHDGTIRSRPWSSGS